jgi:hypothetical protein
MSSNLFAPFAKWRPPGDFSLVEIDSDQFGVGRLGDRDRAERTFRRVGYPRAVVAVCDVDAGILPIVPADLVDVDVVG